LEALREVWAAPEQQELAAWTPKASASWTMRLAAEEYLQQQGASKEA
jgi:hypothetical protein